MILTKEAKVFITPFNIQHYIDKGYKNIVYNKIIIVPIEDLSEKSNIRVDVICDICKKEKNIKYADYKKNFNNGQTYCCCSKCAQTKTKNTSLKRYGVEFTFQEKLFKEKSKITNLKKYGVENARQNEDIKEKVKQNFLKTLGVDNPMKNENIKKKSQETCLIKYGVKYITQTEEMKNKRKKTNLEKYGFENCTQNYEVHEKQQMNGFKAEKYENTNMLYRGTYEKHFLDFCFNNNINIEKPKTIKYIFDNKNKVYFPDFFLKEKNLIIEVKSHYTYKRDLEKNLAKQTACLEQGYNFIFIIDKDYSEFLKILEK